MGPSVTGVTANDIATYPCARHMSSMDVGAMAHRGKKMTEINTFNVRQMAATVTVVVAGLAMSAPFVAVSAFVLQLY